MAIHAQTTDLQTSVETRDMTAARTNRPHPWRHPSELRLRPSSGAPSPAPPIDPYSVPSLLTQLQKSRHVIET